LRIGILGFGNFGQFMAKTFVQSGLHAVYATSRSDYSAEAKRLRVHYARTFAEIEAMAQRHAAEIGAEPRGLDVVIIATSVLSFEKVVGYLTGTPEERSLLANKLVVDVLSVKVHPKTVLLRRLPASCDIVCTHPMFGPESGRHSWQNLPMVFDIVRSAPLQQWRVEAFLDLFANEGCRMAQMTCEMHDEYAAGSQFITHFTGRVLHRLKLTSTPINTKGYETLLTLQENTCKDSFDLFFALYRFNDNSTRQLSQFARAFEQVMFELRDGRLENGAYVPPAASSLQASVLSPTVNQLAGSATVRLHAQTVELIAAGKDVIALNVGEPDWDTPKMILDATKAALDEGHTRLVGRRAGGGGGDVKKGFCAHADKNCFVQPQGKASPHSPLFNQPSPQYAIPC
jgi:prephenate dehydrogenase